MAAKRLMMRKIREILRLKQEKGLSHRLIARAVQVSLGTVSEYLAKAKDVGLSWPLAAELDEEELERRLFPGAEEPAERAEPDYSYIHEELRRAGVTLLLLWVEYVTEHPGGYRYSRFCELYGRWKKKLNVKKLTTYKSLYLEIKKSGYSYRHLFDPKSFSFRTKSVKSLVNVYHPPL